MSTLDHLLKRKRNSNKPSLDVGDPLGPPVSIAETLLRTLNPDKDEQWIQRVLRNREEQAHQRQVREKRAATLRDLGLPKIRANKKQLEGLEAVANHVGLTLDQVKKRSKELQEAGILRRQYKGRPPNRRVVVRGFPSELKAYFDKYPKPRKK